MPSLVKPSDLDKLAFKNKRWEMVSFGAQNPKLIRATWLCNAITILKISWICSLERRANHLRILFLECNMWDYTNADFVYVDGIIYLRKPVLNVAVQDNQEFNSWQNN